MISGRTLKGIVLAGNNQQYHKWRIDHKKCQREYPFVWSYHQMQGIHGIPIHYVGTYWKNALYNSVYLRIYQEELEWKREREMGIKELTQDVLDLKHAHRDFWRNKPQRFWARKLLWEFAELLLSLVGLHRGPVDHELAQIASICMNWREYRREMK